MVIGGDWWCKGSGFEYQHCLLNGHIATLICCKNCIEVCLKKTENKRKKGREWPTWPAILQLNKTSSGFSVHEYRYTYTDISANTYADLFKHIFWYLSTFTDISKTYSTHIMISLLIYWFLYKFTDIISTQILIYPSQILDLSSICTYFYAHADFSTTYTYLSTTFLYTFTDTFTRILIFLHKRSLRTI